MKLKTIEVRQSVSGDVERITQLFYDTIQNININDYSQEEVDDWSSWKTDIDKWLEKMQEQYFVVAVIKNKIVGFSSLALDGYLDFMFVDKDTQGQGVASALLSEIERKANEQNNDVIYSDVSLTAKGFFESKGFIVERQQLKKSKKKELVNYRMTKPVAGLIIREIKLTEYPFLKEMLYQAIFVADEKVVLPREIIEQPDLKKYIQDFGQNGDFCLVAEKQEKLIGAIWIRFIKAYGFVDNETPELSMAVLNEHRGNGIGDKLLTAMIVSLKNKQLKRVSLSVDRDNFAYGFYKKHGFVDYLVSEKSIIMKKELIETQGITHGINVYTK
jgi:putative acetyltransferase